MGGSKSKASVKEGRWGKGRKHQAGAERTKDPFKYKVFLTSISETSHTQAVNGFTQRSTETGRARLELIETSGDPLADISDNT